MKKLSILEAFVVLMCLALASPILAHSDGSAQEQGQRAENHSRKMHVMSGQKIKVKGVIIDSANDSFVMRDMSGAELTVQVSGATKIEEKKSNPFRGAKKYSTNQLIRGLNIEAEGRGNASGDLVAEKVKFEEDDLMVALTVNSQIVPVENRLGKTETRLSQAEQNAERLSGQVEELSEVANLASGGAAAAQETADAAVEGVNRTNDRISSLDDYDVRASTTVNFRVGSAALTAEAKSSLDEVATQAGSERGYVIEVRGFASSDGPVSLNRRLSQQRADAVVRYLAENHDIPLRRITIPFGYGEAMPVADNDSLEGRKQNRRVEIRVMVSKGLKTPVNVNRSVSANRP